MDCYTHYKLAVASYSPVSKALLPAGCKFHQLALVSLKIAVHVVECILRYGFSPSERRAPVSSEDPYMTTSPAYAQRHLVLCRRHLAACRLALAKNGLARALKELTALPTGAMRCQWHCRMPSATHW
jgi:hypothetical protein